MNSFYQAARLILLSILLTAAPPLYAITTDQLARQFESYKKEQAAEFDKIRSENAQLKAENSKLRKNVEQTQQQVETNTEAVEVISDNVENNVAGDRWYDKVTIGGYGEMHFNSLSRKPGAPLSGHFNQLDLHRFVLFFGYEFNDRLRFFSEIEYEHNVTGGGFSGEVELEQAYLEYDLLAQPYSIVDSASVRAGVFLTPIGILNQTHEPGTFYGVERNGVETVIIPSTWWEGGIGSTINFNHGVSVDLGITSGLKMPGTGGNAYRIRSGRQKVSKAVVNNGAFTSRIKYTGISGLTVAGAFQYQDNVGQGKTPGLSSGRLFEVDATYSHEIGPGTATIKGLYALWNFAGQGIIEADGNTQYGWYVEPSYRFSNSFVGDIGLYARYEKVRGWRIQDRYQQWEGGVNWWPHRQVVIKADYRSNGNDINPALSFNGFDLGIGYEF